MEELKDDVYNEVLRLSKIGNANYEEGQLKESISKYKEALKLLPSPKYEWDSFSWLTNNIGISYFDMEDWAMAQKYFRASLLTPQGMEDGLIWFYSGICLEHLSFERESKDAFLRAYTIDKQLFEDESRGHLELIKEDLQGDLL